MSRFFPCFLVSVLTSQNAAQYIDGVAAIIEDHIVLKSELAQMVNMAAIQNRIDPNNNPDGFMRLQNTIVQSMVDQKIMLEMAEIDSIVVEEKEIDQALDQQIQMLVAQAGGEDRAEDALGQPLNDFRREFWYDMRDRLVSERYQQKLLDGISITRSDVVGFFQAYKDSLPIIPMKAKVRHLLIPVRPNPAAKNATVSFLEQLKAEIEEGGSFEDLARDNSQDPGAKNNGGSLGWVNRGSLVKNFETAAFTSDVGKITGPVETEFGYHILETLEKQGDKIRVRHILMIPEITQQDHEKAFNFALSLKEDSIKTLDDFKNIVKRHSTDQLTKDVGGDLGWIDPSNYSVPEIGQAIKYIEMDECSPPINSSIGFHLLWVEGVKKGGRPSLQDHWSDIESMALNKKKMDWYQTWISNARKKFHIQITTN